MILLLILACTRTEFKEESIVLETYESMVTLYEQGDSGAAIEGLRKLHQEYPNYRL